MLRRLDRMSRAQGRYGRPLRRALTWEVLENRWMLAVDLVSVSALGSSSGNSTSQNPQISLDGRFVVFESLATNLVANDTDTLTDVFRRDTLTGTTELVSVSVNNTGSGNGASSDPVISADGRHVAFTSVASNLVAGGLIVSTQNVYVRDMLAGTTSLVSINQFGNRSGNLPSGNPSISRDGRFVAFESQANDLSPVDTNGNQQDIFLRDRAAGTTLLLSLDNSNSRSANGSSSTPVISGNGLFVAFVSQAINIGLVTDINGTAPDVFVRNVVGSTTALASVNRFGSSSGNGGSDTPSISDDGRLVAFASRASDLAPNDTNTIGQDVFVRDLQLGITSLLSLNRLNNGSGNSPSGSPLISRDGTRVVFTSQASDLVANDINGTLQDVFVRNLQTAATTLVSVNASGTGSGNSASSQPVISGEGRFVAFSSTASDLVTEDNTTAQDVFLRDLAANTTTLVSVNSSAMVSTLPSNSPSISESGAAVAFQSQASLVPQDVNGSIQDVYINRAGGAPPTTSRIRVTGPGSGGGPHVRVLDGGTGAERYSLFPYPGFLGGVRVAAGDVTGDGTPDIVTVPGPGGGPHVRVFDGASPGNPVSGAVGSFFAFAPGFGGGLFVATADINRDGRSDIIVGADAGGGPHVRVFNGATGALLQEFFAYAGSFGGGVRVASGDIDGDGTPDIVTAPGLGGGPHVRVFSGASGAVVRDLFAYVPGFTGGVFVSAGDVSGDGRADLVTAAGAGGGPHVKAISGRDNSEFLSLFAYEPGFTGGVTVATGDVDGDGRLDILTGSGPGRQGVVRAFGGTGQLLSESIAYPGFGGGVFVSGSPPASIAGSPLRVAGGAVLPSGPAAGLSPEQVEPLFFAAAQQFAALGLDGPTLERLIRLEVAIADLPGDLLGLAAGDRVMIDHDAAGHGWFLDRTPDAHEEFAFAGGQLVLHTGPSARGVDLLTVLAHELGHVLGHHDLDPELFPGSLMSAVLPSGVRRLPSPELVDQVLSAE